MNRALQIVKKNQLFSLIKKVGLYYGEDIDSLREYAKEVFANNDLDEALACFIDLATYCHEKPTVKVEPAEKSTELKYQPPFVNGDFNKTKPS